MGGRAGCDRVETTTYNATSPPAPGYTPRVARFRVGERVVVTATGETGVIIVEHADSRPRKYTVRIDDPLAAGARSFLRPLIRIYTEDNLEPEDAGPSP
jgi:hypothetical protein